MKLPCGCTISALAAKEVVAGNRRCQLCETTLAKDVTEFDVDEATLEVVKAQNSASGACTVRDIPSSELILETDKDGDPRVLGAGAEGPVYAYSWVSGERSVDVAVKVLTFDTNNRPQLRAKIKNMLSIWQLACVATPHICLLHGVCWKDNKALVVMQRYSESLQDLVAKHNRTGLPRAEALRIACELAKALLGLHNGAKSMHLDVKPRNVLLMDHPPPSVHLSDFGLSRSIRTNIKMSSICTGTTGYASPEQWLENKGNAKADVYSLGATLLFMLTGQDPYAGMAMPQINKVLAKAAHIPIPEHLPPGDLFDLVKAFTAHDASLRPTMADASEMLQHAHAKQADAVGVCPVQRLRFKATDGLVPVVIPCCFQNVSRDGLKHLLTVGPLACPWCGAGLPKKPMSAFYVNNAILRYLEEGTVRLSTPRPCFCPSLLTVVVLSLFFEKRIVVTSIKESQIYRSIDSRPEGQMYIW